MINLQTVKIAESMSYDQKDIFQRITKITEEQGELLEAIEEKDDIDESIEEAIDNILVISSIGFVIDNTSLLEAQKVVNAAFNAPNTHSTHKVLIKYLISTGKMADAIQKQQKIAASSYKGFITSEEALSYVFDALKNVSVLLSTLTDDENLINEIIIKKNKKWAEKSIEGSLAKSLELVVA